ncbi:hypothetical protein ACF061_14750 [Streptomyces sp. NPDC015220]|uniref:hypothetical protein n=1 Tax=Streptomyces sp. NPDC015220 TaxID=3364947 RepID=UPI0036FA0736
MRIPAASFPAQGLWHGITPGPPAQDRSLPPPPAPDSSPRRDPYFRGTDSDRDLSAGMNVEPVQSPRPGGEHVTAALGGRSSPLPRGFHAGVDELLVGALADITRTK